MHPFSAPHISSDLVFDLDAQLQRASCCAVHVVAGPDGPVLAAIDWPTPQSHPQIPPTTPGNRRLPLRGVDENNSQIPPITLVHPKLESFLHAEQLAARVNSLAGTGDSERAAIAFALWEAAR